MTKLVARAPAKLNLTFEIVGNLPYGYHQVLTLLQAIDLEDELTFELSLAEDLEIVICCAEGKANVDFPLDASNLIYKAIQMYLSSGFKNQGLKAFVKVDKKIPIGAGLAGGSSDAAATLLVLNDYFGHPLMDNELLHLGSQLGADVPFCLAGGTCIGRGRGDELETVKHDSQLAFCLVKPRQVSIATAWVYKAFDDHLPMADRAQGIYPNLAGCLDGLKTGNLELLSSCLGNDFESVVFARFPALLRLKEDLLAAGCWSCHLTGSGPTLYGLVADRAMAHMVRRRFFERRAVLKMPNEDADDSVDFWIADAIGIGARLVGK